MRSLLFTIFKALVDFCHFLIPYITKLCIVICPRTYNWAINVHCWPDPTHSVCNPDGTGWQLDGLRVQRDRIRGKLLVLEPGKDKQVLTVPQEATVPLSQPAPSGSSLKNSQNQRWAQKTLTFKLKLV